MKYLYEIEIPLHTSTKEIFDVFEEHLFTYEYEYEDLLTDRLVIGFKTDRPFDHSILSLFGTVKMKDMEVDWDAEWQDVPGYKNGLINYDLSDYLGNGDSITLKPGPGFGDLTHPTTKLMQKHLWAHVQNRVVLDIGCGSGILSLMAAKGDAKEVIGIDIDLKAIKHAKENLNLNRDIKNVVFDSKLPKYNREDSPLVVLINMVMVEQKEVYRVYKHLFDSVPAYFLISGVHMVNQESFYKFDVYSKHQIIEEDQLGEWLFFLTKNF